MVAVWVPALDESDVIFQDRSFFGVNRVEVTPDGIINELRNGNIVHGNQVGGVAWSRRPTTTAPGRWVSC